VHELAVCQELLRQVSEVADRRGATRVLRITVRMGPLSGVEPGLLKRAFTIARAGGIADRARLDIETEPVRIRCGICGEESETAPNRLRCPDCRSGPVSLVSGDALVLARVAMERPGAADGHAIDGEEARYV